MHSGLHCPNPSCGHVFTHETVKGASTLTCPRCGLVFQFRTATAPASPPAASHGSTPPAPPPPVPMAILLPPTPANEAVVFDASPELVTRRGWYGTGGRPVNWLQIGAAAFGILVLVVGLALGLRSLLRSKLDPPAHGFSFHYPGYPWTEDPDMAGDLKTSLALRRSNPESRMALLVGDLGGQSLTDQELIDEGLRRLRGYFQDVHAERKPNRPLAGVMGPRLEFEGERAGVPVEGECYMITHHRNAYWFVTWAPAFDRPKAEQGWEEVRQRFTLLKGNRE